MNEKEIIRSKSKQCVAVVGIALACFFFVGEVGAQTNDVHEPEFGSFEAKEVNPYYTNSSLVETKQAQMFMGGTAESVVEQQNNVAKQQMGYNPPVIPSSDPYEAHNQIANEQKQSKQQRQQQEILEIMNEVHNDRQGDYYSSAGFLSESQKYMDAFSSLNDMLTGKTELSVGKAYYSIEAAYGNTYLTQEEYATVVGGSASFIKAWMLQNGLNPRSSEDLHYGIQEFMSDTLSVGYSYMETKTRTTSHVPFEYDYKDFQGVKDYRNYFITKCFATGTGQCNSMPGIYLVLAEQLGAKAYLCFAPNHSYIKYPDSKGGMHAYEPTSNWSISDKWYVESMGISNKAVMSGIYLDTLNSKMVVANCMLDLAQGYMQKFGVADGEFIKQCLSTAIPYFPNSNNIYTYFLYSSLLAHQLENLLYEHGVTDLSDIDKVEGARELYDALMRNEELIKSLGYKDMPEEMYMKMMQRDIKKGEGQGDTKVKRDLFFNVVE
jgi:tetratricopeptide (TPR) repeat protein